MTKFFRKELKNGMIVVMEKRDLPVVSLCIANKIGAGFEEQAVKGISHLIEHLVFTGTKTRTHEEISREIEKKGGILNAFTANEVTAFWFKLPSEDLFAGLEILADILNNPLFAEEKFEKEKKVILEEIKMYHDDPSRWIYDNLMSNLYEKPFGDSITGSKESVSAMKRDSVRNYFKRRYTAGNYAVVIVGNGDFDEICAYLEKNFQKGKVDLARPEIVKRNVESVEKREGIDQAHFIFGVHAPLLTDENYYALEVLDAYLANGASSQLFLKIREEKGLAYTVSSSINSEKEYSFYSIYVGTMKEAVEEVKKIILAELDNIQKIGEKEVEAAKHRVIGLRKISSEESIKVMTDLLFAELAGDSRTYYQHEQNIRAVSLEQVKKVAAELTKRYSTAVIMPK